MSDFEIIDSCDVEFVQRTRKPKYILSPWNYGNAEGEYQYYKALQRSYKRRHGDIETPYDHYIDQRVDYAKEMENVFPIQLHNLQELVDNLTESSVTIQPWMKDMSKFMTKQIETSYCYICCEYVNVENISEDNPEVCDKCILHAFTCTFCNETMGTEYLSSEYFGISLCLDCSHDEEKIGCDYCGEIVDTSNSIVLDPYDNKKTYCLPCLPEIERYRNADS
jgi:hypothetical protein